jgi:hypothetical protein
MIKFCSLLLKTFVLPVILVSSASIAHGAPTPVHSATQTVRALRFQLSVSPDGTSQLGSPGNYTSAHHWDGTSANPDGTPLLRLLAPEEKRYYVVVSAELALPPGVTPPDPVRVLAQRILRNGSGITLVGEPRTLTLVLVDDGTDASRQPSSDGAGNLVYSYRMYYQDDNEVHRVAGSYDWEVTALLGRYLLQVHPEDGLSNLVEFKIDKRSQIVNTANDWASFYQTQLSLDPNSSWNSSMHPNGLFTHCFSFAGYIYNRHGLTIATTDLGMYPAAEAPDDGEGSLRFYWSNMTPPSAVDDPGHVGVMGSNGTRIDNNGLPTRDPNKFNGPLLRPMDEGVGSAYLNTQQDPLRAPRSRTLKAQRTGDKPNGDHTSLLEELDSE